MNRSECDSVFALLEVGLRSQNRRKTYGPGHQPVSCLALQPSLGTMLPRASAVTAGCISAPFDESLLPPDGSIEQPPDAQKCRQLTEKAVREFIIHLVSEPDQLQRQRSPREQACR